MVKRDNISTINSFFTSFYFTLFSFFPLLGVGWDGGRLVGVGRGYITTLGCNEISIFINPI